MFDIATLILRAAFGLTMALAHGFPKLLNFADKSASFPDPFNLGPVFSMAFVVFAEFFCASLVALGVFTRFTALPVVAVMSVAVFKIHGSQPWANKEPAALFGAAFLAIALLGSGKASLDYLLFKKR